MKIGFIGLGIMGSRMAANRTDFCGIRNPAKCGLTAALLTRRSQGKWLQSRRPGAFASSALQ